MDGTHDIVIPPGTAWLEDPAAQAVCAAVAADGYDVFFVGGCVRNALLGLPDSDVDLSTNARPEEVTRLAEAAGLKAIPTGVEHGTITVVAQGQPFEVTTFRKDVETDGRRAVVAFSGSIEEDARRRDFTMNALYAKADGTVLDPLGGLPDLMARRVRFIEDPQARIREDYLRILRFFRFSAWYAAHDAGFDADTLDAIARNSDGLAQLSAERIGQEMAKLLAAPDPAPALAVMGQTGVLQQILPGSDSRFVAPLVHVEAALGLSPNWITRLAALGGEDAPERFRMSKADSKALAVLGEVGFGGPGLAEVAYRHGVEVAKAAAALRAVLAEQMPDLSVIETVSAASSAVFPVKAVDLMPAYQGPALGNRLAALEAAWIASDFKLSKAELLALP